VSTLNVNRVVDSQGGVLAPISSVMRNRYINGSQTIDQRNAGTSVTLSASAPYVTDRWKCNNNTDGTATCQQISDAPVGFNNSLRYTATATDTNLTTTQSTWVAQYIEGFNAADLGWGTANAKTITVSFWVKSSLTGAFSYSLQNSAFDRSYVTTYTINAANTWEYKTITIPGDTSGTWLKTNGIGIQTGWYLGVGPSLTTGTTSAWQGAGFQSATGSVSVIGTLNATWQITGCQFEVGTQATSFEYRQYGTELALCERYFETSYTAGVAIGSVSDTGVLAYRASGTSANAVFPARFVVDKRAAPIVTIYNPVTGAASSLRNDTAGTNITVSAVTNIGTSGFGYVTANTALTDQNGYFIHFAANSEL
jgi:hypothetical protein